jgi:hypothetical protein
VAALWNTLLVINDALFANWHDRLADEEGQGAILTVSKIARKSILSMGYGNA